jgi:hypothetical protein
MNQSDIIIWEKWRDPLGYDDVEEMLDHDKKNIPKYTDEIQDDELIEEDEKNVIVKNIKDQFALTPLGLIPLTENTVSSKIFNFWTGHTTFPISKDIASIIEEIVGIETLDVFTRYRFRISVGKAFNDSYVLRNINETIFKYLEKFYDTKNIE